MEQIYRIITAQYALKNKIVPLQTEDGFIRIAALDDAAGDLLNELQFLLNKKVRFEKWTEEEIVQEIHRRYRIVNERVEPEEDHSFEFLEKRPETLEEKAIPKIEDHSVIRLVNNLISDAIRKKASDIHIESFEENFRVRFRIDGKLIEAQKLPRIKKQAIISRIKIMADMDIAEKRRPQDGRIRMQNGKKAIDIRASTLPTDFGEKIVLRILDKSSVNLSLDCLGFENDVLANFKRILQLPYGMILVTGPTGSGKTTTLYSALNYLNKPDVNIITIEDPIEYNLDGINQTMVKPEIGLSFANVLRTILRQDPNIIMVGEIRDSETAEIAIRAALTGHLVLSTLHTNDAISTIIRLMDMGIEPFLLSSSLKLIIAQRLVRKICPYCKKKENVDEKLLKNYHLRENMEAVTFYSGAGCKNCFETGYSGREAIIEHLIVDEDVSGLILKGASFVELKNLAGSKGLISLKEAALNKARAGVTSLSEVISEILMN